jgi:hypothetical protein
MRTLLIPAAFAALTLTGCGEAVRDDHYSNEAQAQPVPNSPPVQHRVAVRIGELGPSFDACGAAGTTRRIAAGKALAVRAAPVEDAEETGGIAAGQRFFVCARSHNQKWLGVIYEPGGTLAESCGVSLPVTSRRAYEGPCKSGWVASPFVRLVAGTEVQALPNQDAGDAPVEATANSAQ